MTEPPEPTSPDPGEPHGARNPEERGPRESVEQRIERLESEVRDLRKTVADLAKNAPDRVTPPGERAAQGTGGASRRDSAVHAPGGTAPADSGGTPPASPFPLRGEQPSGSKPEERGVAPAREARPPASPTGPLSRADRWTEARTVLEDAAGRRAPGWDTTEDLEARIGQIWISRAGLVLVLLALALFMKWAYDRNLISYEVRTALGVLVGLGLTTAGEAMHRRSARFAEAFTGAGIAAFYVTFFAAYQLYHLFGQTTSFVLMVAATAFAVVLAVRHDAPAIAGLGIIGGFTVPYLLPGAEPRLEPVLVYYIVLEAGLAAAVRRLARFRDELLVLSVVAAFSAPAPAVLGAGVSFPIWLGYFLVLSAGVGWLVPRMSLAPRLVGAVLGILAVLPFLAPAAGALRAEKPEPIAVYMVVVYAGLVVLCRRLGHSRIATPIATASAILGLAVSLAPESIDSAMAHSGRVAWWGVAGCGLIALVAVAATARESRAASAVALALGGPIGLLYLEMAPRSGFVVESLFPVAMLILFLLPPMLRRDPGPLDLPMILGSPLLFGAVLWGLLERHTLVSLQGALMLLLAAIYASAAFVAATSGQGFLRLAYAGVGIAFLTLVFPAQFDAETVTIAWAVESAALVFVGLRTGHWIFRAAGGIVLGFAFARYVFFDARLDEAASYTWSAFTNPRAVGAAFIASAAFTVMGLYARARSGADAGAASSVGASDRKPPLSSRLPAGAAERDGAMIAAGLLANAMLLLGITLEVDLLFDHIAPAGTAAGVRGVGNREVEQFVLTAYYALHSIALVAVGLWRSVREARILGLTLFAATLGKVVLVDLSFLDTIYRVFSFLALGMLLVAASLLYRRFAARFEPPGGQI